MKTFSKTRRWLIVAILSVILSWVAYTILYNTHVANEEERFQKEFTKLEKKQKNFVTALTKDIEHNTIQDLWNTSNLRNNEFIVQIYDDGTLVYWNSNTIHFNQNFSGSHSHFVGKFPNGHYLVDKFKVQNLQVYVCSKIKNDFYYQNKALKNTISDHFSTTNELKIEWEKNENNTPIVSLHGTKLFFITILKDKSLGKYSQWIIYCLYVLGLLSLLISLTYFIRPLAEKKWGLIFVYPLLLLGLRYCSIRFGWVSLFNGFEIYDPGLYANSRLIPNLGSLILSLGCIAIVVWWFIYFLSRINAFKNRGVFLLILSYIGILIYSIFINHILESLVVNSSISLVIDEVFSLTLYSFIALLIIASLFLSYYLFIRQVSIKMVNSKIPLNIIALIWFGTGVLFALMELVYFRHNLIYASWPLLLNALFFYLATKKNRLNSLKYHIAIVIVIGFYGAIILFENNQSNEHQKRELYANQLITDQDPAMEIEYGETINQLKENPELYQLLDGVQHFSAANFYLQIENCCFGEFWERYEINFFFFKPDGSPLIQNINSLSQSKSDLDHIIEKHATPSSISKGLFFVKDYYNQLSYISHLNLIKPDSTHLDLYIQFRSKKIPEKIGFPRLLMNEKSYALQNLEDYSIARYSMNNLVMKFGKYNYPTKLDFFNLFNNKSGFITINDVNHYVYHQNDGQTVIISKPQKRFIEQLSTFSYLVIFFSVFALLVLILFNWNKIFPFTTLQLSFKVQLILIGMMVATFFIFVVLAIQNVTHQYNVYTKDNLKGKISSVEREIDQKYGNYEGFSSLQQDALSNYLKSLSETFSTDINFFSPSGHLLATSQSKLYDKGITTRQINSQAYYSVHYHRRSEFIHHEKFGLLTFLSGYIPYANHEGKLLGYINLQHFSQQNVYEQQMNEFIVAAINVAVLLLVVSVLLAIIVSGWITAPLRLIQQSFRKMELGKENQPIAYAGDDEIGALVKDYNDKLAELELKAMQLARSERETAWREMAKQVAHEIKNPLTPMRLSVQHFQRSFDPNDPNAKKKMQRIVDSLIEQIDALTKIANEFSNFAKMPKSNEENIDLVVLLRNVKELYSSKDVEIELKIEEGGTVDVYADKNLILRVFNNLIKNAIQATKEGEKSLITIRVSENEGHYIIAVKDNGVGIPEHLKEKMFVPNFTTKSTGSGLGLAMVKQIVLNHNGTIWFESEENVGTTFFVMLPQVK